jgi:hypothetical protein
MRADEIFIFAARVIHSDRSAESTALRADLPSSKQRNQGDRAISF